MLKNMDYIKNKYLVKYNILHLKYYIIYIMPAIPKYNQRSTNDLNYAKRRVVDAEKKGIAKLISPGMKDITNGDAQKIAEKILEYLDEVMILIQKAYAYFNEVNMEDFTQYNLRNTGDIPKVFAIIIIISKFISKILNLAKKLRNVINFVDPQTIESLKNKLEELDYLGGSFKENLLSQFIIYIKTIAGDELTEESYISETESIVSDLDSIISDLTDDFGSDFGSDVTERSDDFGSDVTERSDDFGSDETGQSTGRRTASTARTRRFTIGKNIYKMYKGIVNKFLRDASELYNILINSIDDYNQARIQQDEVLSERKNEISREYAGSGRVYSVGNKYAEQMYNSQGLYK